MRDQIDVFVFPIRNRKHFLMKRMNMRNKLTEPPPARRDPHMLPDFERIGEYHANFTFPTVE